MKFGKVIGRVVCNPSDQSLTGVKLLVVQPLTARLKPKGAPYIAADALWQAGQGDIVTVVFSADATRAFDVDQIPVDASIVGLVDSQTAKLLGGE